MNVRIWGCRGSLASPGPATVAYGGNTSCVEVRLDDGTVLVLDAGSGMRCLGSAMGVRPGVPVHILLTHLHLDHLQGLPFFGPFWQEGEEMHVWGPPSPTHDLASRVATLFSPPLFPVHLADVPSNPTFHDVPEEAWTIGPATVSACNVAHNGPTIGYRIECGGRSLAYIPDHEPWLGVGADTLEPSWISGYGVADGVDVLLHDAQYFEDEYDTHVGWGHSSVAHVVALAKAAGVRQLVLFHHDPSHSDEDLERLLVRAKELWGPDGHEPILAAEGMELDLSRAPAVVVPS